MSTRTCVPSTFRTAFAKPRIPELKNPLETQSLYHPDEKIWSECSSVLSPNRWRDAEQGSSLLCLFLERNTQTNICSPQVRLWRQSKEVSLPETSLVLSILGLLTEIWGSWGQLQYWESVLIQVQVRTLKSGDPGAPCTVKRPFGRWASPQPLSPWGGALCILGVLEFSWGLWALSTFQACTFHLFPEF